MRQRNGSAERATDGDAIAADVRQVGVKDYTDSNGRLFGRRMNDRVLRNFCGYLLDYH